MSGCVGDFEAEVRFGSRDVPVAEFIAEEVTLEIIGDFGLQVVSALGPFFEKLVVLFDADEQVVGCADFRGGSGECTAWFDQVGGAEVGQALVAAVAVLFGCRALGAGASDKPVGEEGAFDGVEELSDLLFVNQVGIAECLPDLGTLRPVFIAVGTAVVVEFDIEAGEVTDMSRLHFVDQLGFAATFLSSTNHDRRAVCVVGTQVDAAVASEFLEADPDVGLDVLDQVADVDVPVGVGQRRSHQDPTPVHDPYPPWCSLLLGSFFRHALY